MTTALYLLRSLRPATNQFPFQGALGVSVIAFAWPASWLRFEPAGDFAFFPLWLGYILMVDAFVELRTGSSLLRRNRGAFLALFTWCVPLWWAFEGINHFPQNWHYLGGEHYSTLE